MSAATLRDLLRLNGRALAVLGAAGSVLLYLLVTRFYALAERPLHHDESLFAYYAYQIYMGRGYNYMPILHGPVLQYLNAFFFLLFGDSDTVMRLPAAVGGVGLVAALWLWRPLLPAPAVATAAVLWILSPSLTCYSRFLRNDILYLGATAVCAALVLRAAKSASRRELFLALMAAAVMFSMMESSIFFFVQCLCFAGALWLADIYTAGQRPAGAAERPEAEPRAGRYVASALAAALAGTYLLERVLGDSIPVVRGLGTYLAIKLGGGGDSGEPEPLLWAARILVFLGFLIPCAMVAVAAAVSAGRAFGACGWSHRFVHWVWRGRWVFVAGLAAAFALYGTLFTTFFTHLTDNDFQGRPVHLTPFQIYKNTFDYWFDQHQQHRIKGPFHYYFPLLLNYELPALLLAVWGFVKSVASLPRGRAHLAGLAAVQVVAAGGYVAGTVICRAVFGLQISWTKVDEILHMTHSLHFAMALFYVQIGVHIVPVLLANRRPVEAFVLLWTVFQLFAYSYAGEKVPWLVIHIAAPLNLLAAIYLGRALMKPAGQGEQAVQRRGRGLRVAAVTACFALLAVYQVRQTAWACFIEPWSPADRLIYNHTSPDVKVVMGEIERIAAETNLGYTLPIYMEGEMQWPFYWYMRRYANVALPGGDETALNTSRPVVLVDWFSPATERLGAEYDLRRLKLREFWEPPALRANRLADILLGLTPRDSRGAGSENGARLSRARQEWARLLHYVAYRTIWVDLANPAASNGANEMALAIRRDIPRQMMTYGALNAAGMRRDLFHYVPPPR